MADRSAARDLGPRRTRAPPRRSAKAAAGPLSRSSSAPRSRRRSSDASPPPHGDDDGRRRARRAGGRSPRRRRGARFAHQTPSDGEHDEDPGRRDEGRATGLFPREDRRRCAVSRRRTRGTARVAKPGVDSPPERRDAICPAGVRVGRPERLQLPEEAHEIQEVVLEAVELGELEEEREVVGVLLEGLLELADAGVVEWLLALSGAERGRPQERLRRGVVRRAGDRLVGGPERLLGARVPVLRAAARRPPWSPGRAAGCARRRRRSGSRETPGREGPGRVTPSFS